MAKIVGHLESIFTKSFANGGDAVFIKVGGIDYKFGKYAPRGFAEGDFVEFEAQGKSNGQYTNWTADYKTLRKSDPAAAGNPAPQPSPQPRGFTPTSNDERQETISRQAAFNTSLAFVKMAIEAGAIAVPTKVKKDQLLDFYTTVVDHCAMQFYAKSTGKTWTIEEPKAKEADEFEDQLPGDDEPW